MAQTSLELLEAAGLAFELGARSLHVPCSNAPVELLLVRPHDIPEYVQDGVVDAGITGANLIAETGSQVETLLELGFGRCTLEAAVPEESALKSVADLDGLRVATAYPVTTKPEYVQDDVVDAGITGANLIAETGSQVETLLELGFGRCTLEAAVPEESSVQR